MCWKQPNKEIAHLAPLVSLVLNLRSPELLDGGGETIGSGVEVDKTEHSEERHNQVEDLESLAHVLHVNHRENAHRSAVIAPDVAHTDASVHGVKDAKDVVNGHLERDMTQDEDTQIADGARTNDTGNRTAAVSWE